MTVAAKNNRRKFRLFARWENRSEIFGELVKRCATTMSSPPKTSRRAPHTLDSSQSGVNSRICVDMFDDSRITGSRALHTNHDDHVAMTAFGARAIARVRLRYQYSTGLSTKNQLAAATGTVASTAYW